MNDVATEYLTDWTGVGWSVSIAALLLSLPSLAFVGLTLGNASQEPGTPTNRRGLALAGCWLLGVCALGAVALLPGAMMRHFPSQSLSGLVGAVLVVVAGLLAYLGYRVGNRWESDRIISGWWLYVPAIVIGLGALIGLIFDALSRVAATVPMAVGTLVLLIAAGTFLMASKARD